MPHEQRFEYHIEKIEWTAFEDVAQDRFDELAEDGWELAESAQVSSHTTYYIFQRPT